MVSGDINDEDLMRSAQKDEEDELVGFLSNEGERAMAP